jgi:uncharacterized membrane protein YkgB
MHTEVVHVPANDLDFEQRIEQRLPPGIRRVLERSDDAIRGFLEAYGITLLRVAVALVFIWFGALKVIGRSPVEDLVADTAYFIDADFVVVFLGVWEIVVGLGLLIPIALRLTLLLFWAQMAGTFLVLLMHPGLSFQGGNPMLLELTGEFVIKNLVLIAAGLVIGSTVRQPRRHARGFRRSLA